MHFRVLEFEFCLITIWNHPVLYMEQNANISPSQNVLLVNSDFWGCNIEVCEKPSKQLQIKHLLEMFPVRICMTSLLSHWSNKEFYKNRLPSSSSLLSPISHFYLVFFQEFRQLYCKDGDFSSDISWAIFKITSSNFLITSSLQDMNNMGH